VTVQQAADRLGVSHSTVRREIADGRLLAWRVRGRIVVDEADVERYRREAQVAPAPVPAGADDDDENWRPLG
jgi:excisionase family DNA binding protein